MEIKTKFNKGQKVFILIGTKLQKTEIHSIKIDIDQVINIKYWFRIGDKNDYKFETANEKEVFETKEEFLKQL